MIIVLIRHARAEERRLLQRDANRALTADGRRRFRRAARGLHNTLPGITRIVASPLLRARETAALLSDVYRHAELERQSLLAPGQSPPALLAWLATQPPESRIALIGHEPDLGRFAGRLLTGRDAGLLVFKKGAAACVAFDAVPRAGRGVLQWFMTAGQLAAQA